MKFNRHFLFSVMGTLLLSGCVVSNDSEDTFAQDDEEVAEVASAVCSSQDLDQGASCQSYNGASQCGTQIAPYADQVGWTRYWWPSSNQLHCEFPIDDWRLYWTNSFVANPANRGTIRLRYVGSDPDCKRPSYSADYLTKNGQKYLRITLSSNPSWAGPCNASEYVLVAP